MMGVFLSFRCAAVRLGFTGSVRAVVVYTPLTLMFEELLWVVSVSISMGFPDSYRTLTTMTSYHTT